MIYIVIHIQVWYFFRIKEYNLFKHVVQNIACKIKKKLGKISISLFHFVKWEKITIFFFRKNKLYGIWFVYMFFKHCFPFEVQIEFVNTRISFFQFLLKLFTTELQRNISKDDKHKGKLTFIFKLFKQNKRSFNYLWYVSRNSIAA